jgi:hypothetical protein
MSRAKTRDTDGLRLKVHNVLEWPDNRFGDGTVVFYFP